jgi:hypothetical protein
MGDKMTDRLSELEKELEALTYSFDGREKMRQIMSKYRTTSGDVDFLGEALNSGDGTYRP